MPGARVWGYLGIVEITLEGLGTFPVAFQKQVVKSGRHIASIWEPFGSVVAPFCGLGLQQQCLEASKRSYLWLCENSDISMCLIVF